MKATLDRRRDGTPDIALEVYTFYTKCVDYALWVTNFPDRTTAANV
jgi:hypothetical protein